MYFLPKKMKLKKIEENTLISRNFRMRNQFHNSMNKRIPMMMTKSPEGKSCNAQDLSDISSSDTSFKVSLQKNLKRENQKGRTLLKDTRKTTISKLR